MASPPVLKGFKSIGVPYSDATVVTLFYEEYEALRLADYAGMKQEEFCECPKCNYQVLHEFGVPCFSNTCPDCKTPLFRKSG